MATLEERLARLEAIEDIKALKARYCAYADDDYDADGIAEQFVVDGSWEGGTFGRYEGREAIRGFLKGIGKDIVFAAHLVMNPIIEIIDEAHAKGQWRLLMPSTVMAEGGREARWLLCHYAETYVKQDGRWMFKDIKMTINFYSPHLKGWA